MFSMNSIRYIGRNKQCLSQSLKTSCNFIFRRKVSVDHHQLCKSKEEVVQKLNDKPVPVQSSAYYDNHVFAVNININGYEKKNILVLAANDNLYIKGKRILPDTEGPTVQYFLKGYTLPEGCQPSSMTCTLENGILSIRAPRLGETREREREETQTKSKSASRESMTMTSMAVMPTSAPSTNAEDPHLSSIKYKEKSRPEIIRKTWIFLDNGNKETKSSQCLNTSKVITATAMSAITPDSINVTSSSSKLASVNNTSTSVNRSLSTTALESKKYANSSVPTDFPKPAAIQVSQRASNFEEFNYSPCVQPPVFQPPLMSQSAIHLSVPTEIPKPVIHLSVMASNLEEFNKLPCLKTMKPPVSQPPTNPFMTDTRATPYPLNQTVNMSWHTNPSLTSEWPKVTQCVDVTHLANPSLVPTTTWPHLSPFVSSSESTTRSANAKSVGMDSQSIGLSSHRSSPHHPENVGLVAAKPDLPNWSAISPAKESYLQSNTNAPVMTNNLTEPVNTVSPSNKPFESPITLQSTKTLLSENGPTPTIPLTSTKQSPPEKPSYALSPVENRFSSYWASIFPSNKLPCHEKATNNSHKLEKQ